MQVQPVGPVERRRWPARGFKQRIEIRTNDGRPVRTVTATARNAKDFFGIPSDVADVDAWLQLQNMMNQIRDGMTALTLIDRMDAITSGWSSRGIRVPRLPHG